MPEDPQSEYAVPGFLIARHELPPTAADAEAEVPDLHVDAGRAAVGEHVPGVEVTCADAR